MTDMDVLMTIGNCNEPMWHRNWLTGFLRSDSDVGVRIERLMLELGSPDTIQ